MNFFFSHVSTKQNVSNILLKLKLVFAFVQFNLQSTMLVKFGELLAYQCPSQTQNSKTLGFKGFRFVCAQNLPSWMYHLTEAIEHTTPKISSLDGINQSYTIELNLPGCSALTKRPPLLERIQKVARSPDFNSSKLCFNFYVFLSTVEARRSFKWSLRNAALQWQKL